MHCNESAGIEVETDKSRETMPSLLFAYGTLMPADAEAVDRDGWRPDAVLGRLFDLGTYPALVDLDHPEAGWVEGFVRSVTIEELIHRFDPWEDVDAGLYRREQTTTRAGSRVWVYVYNQPLPPSARGPFPRWERHRRARV